MIIFFFGRECLGHNIKGFIRPSAIMGRNAAGPTTPFKQMGPGDFGR